MKLLFPPFKHYYSEVVSDRATREEANFQGEVKASQRKIDRAYKRWDFSVAERLGVLLETMLERRHTKDEEKSREVDQAEDFYDEAKGQNAPGPDSFDFSPLEEELARLYYTWLTDEGGRFDEKETINRWSQQFVDPRIQAQVAALMKQYQKGLISHREMVDAHNKLEKGHSIPPYERWPKKIKALMHYRKVFADQIYDLFRAEDIGDWRWDRVKSRSELSDDQLLEAAKDAWENWHNRKALQRQVGHQNIPIWAKNLFQGVG